MTAHSRWEDQVATKDCHPLLYAEAKQNEVTDTIPMPASQGLLFFFSSYKMITKLYVQGNRLYNTTAESQKRIEAN